MYFFYVARLWEKRNCGLTEGFSVARVCERISRLTGTAGVIDTPPRRPPGNGKIDAARIADSVPRLNGALPISYTQFPPKRKKNACELLFRPRRSLPPPARPPAQLFFSQLLIVFGGRISYRRTTRVSVILASSPSRENFRNIIFFTPRTSHRIIYAPLRSNAGEATSELESSL